MRFESLFEAIEPIAIHYGLFSSLFVFRLKLCFSLNKNPSDKGLEISYLPDKWFFLAYNSSDFIGYWKLQEATAVKASYYHSTHLTALASRLTHKHKAPPVKWVWVTLSPFRYHFAPNRPHLAPPCSLV